MVSIHWQCYVLLVGARPECVPFWFLAKEKIASLAAWFVLDLDFYSAIRYYIPQIIFIVSQLYSHRSHQRREPVLTFRPYFFVVLFLTCFVSHDIRMMKQREKDNKKRLSSAGTGTPQFILSIAAAAVQSGQERHAHFPISKMKLTSPRSAATMPETASINQHYINSRLELYTVFCCCWLVLFLSLSLISFSDKCILFMHTISTVLVYFYNRIATGFSVNFFLIFVYACMYVCLFYCVAPGIAISWVVLFFRVANLSCSSIELGRRKKEREREKRWSLNRVELIAKYENKISSQTVPTDLCGRKARVSRKYRNIIFISKSKPRNWRSKKYRIYSAER